MEPSKNKRNKWANIILLTVLLVFSSITADAKELRKENISKQQKATLKERDMKLSEMEKSEIELSEPEENESELSETEEDDLGLLEREEPMEYTEEDLELLATVMYAEAGICDDQELYRVANVVINRVNDDSGIFKNSIEGVIYQKGQFASVGESAWNRGPTEREERIAKDVLEGARIFPEEVVWFSRKQMYGTEYYTSKWHVFSSL